MRTETEMLDLVRAKVAAHRRRRTLLASAGGGVAVALLLVAVAAGATSARPEESVKAGEGQPTSTVTTEEPTTGPDAPDEPDTPTTVTSTTSTTTEPTSTVPVAPPPPPPPTTEPAPTTTTTEPAPPTTTAPAWPAVQSSFTHGGATWAVYLAVAEAPDDPSFATAEAQAGAVGYDARGPNDLGCDEGAAEAFGYDLSTTTYSAVALYFPTEQDALRFVDLYEPEVLRVVLVGTYCLD